MTDLIAKLYEQGIAKKLLGCGKGDLPEYADGTKIFFHYRTTKCDDEKTVIDDSRKHEKPMELIIGKKFKLEVWEDCLKTMRDKERALFIADTKHVMSYPHISKSLRGIFGKDKNHEHHEGGHCCGMMAMAEQGLGYPDLDDLVKNPQPLEFTLEILNVQKPNDYEKDAWAMSEEERTDRIPVLKEEGNALYAQKKYGEAAEKYGEALGLLEQKVLKEKPGDTEWEKLEDMKKPFLLNFSQCKINLQEYYPAIEHLSTVLKRDPEHLSTVLKRDPDNVKALFRRGRAHVGAWNPEEAREDFNRVVELDSTLSGAVKKEIKILDDKQKLKDENDKQKLKGLFS
ncbi:AIP [Mytilus coruscus]|uniref:AIP n=1 Tax=Mytilus coruscus TaxID=42192 RepID=A0A6J8C014_MYTCO|nr:unnamed protein product [Mytilus coruscus]CAC5388987.1 AIP [Mytilus coruscus]